MWFGGVFCFGRRELLVTAELQLKSQQSVGLAVLNLKLNLREKLHWMTSKSPPVPSADEAVRF